MSRKKDIRIVRKRNGKDLRSEALQRLKDRWENEEEFDPSGEPKVSSLIKSQQTLAAMRASANEDCQAFIELHDSLTGQDKKWLTWEEIAYSCGIGSIRLLEVAVSATYEYNQTETKLLIAKSMRKVVQATVKAATDQVPIVATDLISGQIKVVGQTNGDVRAMELFGKMSGLVPIPKGAQIAIQNNVAAPEEDKPTGRAVWMDAEERLRAIKETIEPKRLPSPATEPVSLGGRIDHMQAQTAEILVERDV